MKRSYTMSSSDEDFSMKTKKTSKTLDEDNELFADILKNNKVQKFSFRGWKSCNTLFYDEISNDDEIFLVQCPKNTDLTALSNAKVDFDSVVSKTKFRVNGLREKLSVYSVEDYPRQVNLALPNRATKTFQLKALPVAGRLIMQKDIRIKPIKTEPEVIDLEPPPPKLEKEEIIDEIKSESLTPQKNGR